MRRNLEVVDTLALSGYAGGNFRHDGRSAAKLANHDKPFYQPSKPRAGIKSLVSAKNPPGTLFFADYVDSDLGIDVGIQVNINLVLTHHA